MEVESSGGWQWQTVHSINLHSRGQVQHKAPCLLCHNKGVISDKQVDRQVGIRDHGLFFLLWTQKGEERARLLSFCCRMTSNKVKQKHKKTVAFFTKQSSKQYQINHGLHQWGAGVWHKTSKQINMLNQLTCCTSAGSTLNPPGSNLHVITWCNFKLVPLVFIRVSTHHNKTKLTPLCVQSHLQSHFYTQLLWLIW